MNLPIRARMTAWYLILLIAILVAAGAFLLLRLRADLVDATDRALVPAVHQIAAGYEREGIGEFLDQSATVLAEQRAASQVLAADGNVLRSYGAPVGALSILDPARIRTVLREGLLVFTRSLGPTGTQFRVAATPVLRNGAPRIVVAAATLQPVDRAVHRLLELLLLVLPVALVVAALGGWLLARRALRPIDQMVGAAELIGPRDLRDRIAVPATRDEVAHLGRTLNAMLDRMQRGVEEQQRVVADSSHELRTPLAAMRTELDVSLHTDDLPANARAVLESARDEVDRMSAIVDDLLILASADERSLRPVRAPVDLARIAGDAAHALTWLAGSRRVELAVEGPPAPAHADPDQLGHVVRNLVDNAIKFSPEGGRVTVRTFVDDHSVGVRVEDHGDGIPEQMRDRVFDRFLRVDGSRSRSSGGSGLGLAIARTLVVANGGAIAVAPHEPRGSVFTVELPRTD